MKIKSYHAFFMLAVFLAAAAYGSDETAGARPARLVNGTVIEGTIAEISGEGMVMKTAKGLVTYPWKYLSAGTRFRYRDNKPADQGEGKATTE